MNLITSHRGSDATTSDQGRIYDGGDDWRDKVWTQSELIRHDGRDNCAMKPRSPVFSQHVVKSSEAFPPSRAGEG